jgi:hypothetical protein
MKKLTLALAALALVATTMASPEAKPWREIATGSQSGIETPGRTVIRTPEAWQAWWKEHTKNEFDPANPNEPPKVDFDKEMILAATMGERSTGGFAIHFTEIKTEGGTLKVIVKSTSPGPDAMVTMALTQPFAIIAVPKHDGEVVFTDG